MTLDHRNLAGGLYHTHDDLTRGAIQDS